MNINIRQAKIEDAAELTEAEREIAAQPGFLVSKPFELDEERFKGTISKILQNNHGQYFVAEVEEKIVGHAFLEPLSLTAISHIASLTIVVHSGWQEKGIGKLLLQRLIDWAKQSKNIEKIVLQVRSTNARAIALYKQMGFIEEGILKNNIKISKGQYIDDIIMGLDLLGHKFQPKLEMQDATIRSIQEEDLDNLIKTFCFPWSSVQATHAKWTRYYAEHQKLTRTVFLLVKQGQIIGYASLLRLPEYPDFKNADIPEINDVWVSEEWRNKGYGKKLLLYLEDVARRENYKQIGVGVGLYQDYGTAQKLYFKLGYAPNGKGVTYKTVPVTPGKEYPVDDDLILWMTKSLI